MSSFDPFHPLSDFPILCRPALPKDTAEVMALTRMIWEGEDYVPYVWEDWLKDPEGLLLVAEYGGKVVGLGKTTLLAAGQWWQEGLRVHPNFQGRGIASHIHNYQLDYWLRNGDGIIRLATGASRKAVHHLCERTGFRKIGEYSAYAAPAIAEAVESFRPLSAEEVSAALDFALQSPALPLAYGLMDLGWQWATPNVCRLEMAVRAGQVRWWRKDQGLMAAWQDSDLDGTKHIYVQLLTCPVEAMVECLLDYRRLAAQMGYAQAAWVAPLHPDLLPILIAAGFQRDWEDALFVFEKVHS